MTSREGIDEPSPDSPDTMMKRLLKDRSRDRIHNKISQKIASSIKIQTEAEYEIKELREQELLRQAEADKEHKSKSD